MVSQMPDMIIQCVIDQRDKPSSPHTAYSLFSITVGSTTTKMIKFKIPTSSEHTGYWEIAKQINNDCIEMIVEVGRLADWCYSVITSLFS